MENKKVILIKGSESQCYEQAIFIMKSTSAQKKPTSLVKEAEKIINDYIKYNNLQIPSDEMSRRQRQSAESGECSRRKSKTKKNPFSEKLLNICIVLTCIILAAAIYNLLIV